MIRFPKLCVQRLCTVSFQKRARSFQKPARRWLTARAVLAVLNLVDVRYVVEHWAIGCAAFAATFQHQQVTKMAHRKQAILCLLEDYEAETGLDASKLPEDAWKHWCAAVKHR